MRVITGQAKGIRLRTPKTGRIRPTSSRVRSAIFAVLDPDLVNGAAVLDLYAGTGALGIEALSREAEHVDFVERDRRACQLIRDNLSAAGLRDRATVYVKPVKTALALLEGPYDLVIMDPPYAETDIDRVLTQLSDAGVLGEGAVVVVEHAWREVAVERASRLALQSTRRYGDTAISFYRQEPEG